MVNCALGHSKHKLIRVFTDVAVGEAVFSLGQYVNFNVEMQEAAATTSATTDAVVILLQSGILFGL